MELGQEQNNQNLEQNKTALIVNQAATVLQQGGIILFPCDTVWGLLSADLTREGIANLNAIKGRKIDQPIALVNSINSNDAKLIWKYIHSKPQLRRYFPGNLTVIVPISRFKAIDPRYIDIGLKTSDIGIRIVSRKHSLEQLIDYSGALLATSANFHLQPISYNLIDIPFEIKRKVNYIADISVSQLNRASVIYDLKYSKYLR